MARTFAELKAKMPLGAQQLSHRKTAEMLDLIVTTESQAEERLAKQDSVVSEIVVKEGKGAL